jgi:beta-glucanase (GH16 family)
MPGAIPGWTQTFADDFTSPASLNNYQVYESDGASAQDGSESCWAQSHTVVAGGELQLRGYKDPAAIQANGCTQTTNDLVTAGVKLTANTQTYGKYEVRMRVDNGEGVSAVALLWPAPDSWPPEIDFAEDDGASPRNQITATSWGTNGSVISDPLTINFSQWHTFGVEWSPGKLVYTVDGTVWATMNSPEISSQPMQLALQTEAWQCGTSVAEQCANASTPSEVDMDVDWIVVYTAG